MIKSFNYAVTYASWKPSLGIRGHSQDVPDSPGPDAGAQERSTSPAAVIVTVALGVFRRRISHRVVVSVATVVMRREILRDLRRSQLHLATVGWKQGTFP